MWSDKRQKDVRGRWKGRGRVSDIYDDIELPYPDAKVAEKLFFFGKDIMWLLFLPAAEFFCIPAEFMNRIKQLLRD
jgi:hypothetical protein